MPTTPVIHASGLIKNYGSVRALNGFDLTVEQGEVMGFLGPNGAGKSTTIRVLLGLIRATAGTVEVCGHDPWRDAAAIHRHLAYVPGDVTLWPGLTGGQCIDILTHAHGGANESRCRALIERFDLDPTKKFRTYSKGNRQKVSLVAALGVDADLLLLDEPTSGLDPLMEVVFQQVVRERVEQGATVLLSSHILSEVEALADRVTIIKKGEAVSTGTLAELRAKTQTEVHAVTRQTPRWIRSLNMDTLEATPAGKHHSLRCVVDSEDLEDLIGGLHAAGLVSLTVLPPSLNQLFQNVYGTDAEVVSA